MRIKSSRSKYNTTIKIIIRKIAARQKRKTFLMTLPAAPSNKKVLCNKMKGLQNQLTKNRKSRSQSSKDPKQKEERTISATFAKEQARNSK
jgi:hypothetical protein